MMEYEDRGEWQARPPKRKPHNIKATGIIFNHHTVGQQAGGARSVREIQAFHMDVKGWNDVAYNWLYDDDGAIFEGRGWFVAGGATKGWNTMSHSFAYMGNTMTHVPSNAAKQAQRRLTDEAVRLMGPQQQRAHNEVRATLCPGTNLLAWLAAGRPVDREIMATAWQDEPAFDLAIQMAYELTGPNRRTPTGEDRAYWLMRFTAGDDPAWLIAACKDGLSKENPA